MSSEFKEWRQTLKKEYDVTLTIPEGYEPAPGDQPRQPKFGDLILTSKGNVEDWLESGDIKHRAIILQKIKPRYETRIFGTTGGAVVGVPAKKYVEIQALKDALAIIEEGRTQMSDKQLVIYNALPEVVK
jgi:hypothetical protein